ncbi:MAG: T9SS type A sorting domain-containing protein [Balneolaceae bacterium]
MKILHNCLENKSKSRAAWRYMLVMLLLFAANAQSTAQTMMPLPNFNNVYSGNVRGYWFTAPTSFIITGVKVPTDAGTGLQNIQIIKINDATPVAWSASSTNFTTLAYIQGATNDVVQSLNLMVNQGDIIGVLGQAGLANSYSVTGGPFSSTILGQPVTLNRLIHQGNLTSGPATDYSWEVGSAAISRVELYYNSPTPCSGAPSGGTANGPALACGAFGLSLSGSTSASDITYQWLSAPAANGPWTSIAGATSPNATITQTGDSYYACEVTCTNSNLADTSVAVFVQSPPMIAPFYEGFDNASQPQCWENLSSTVSTSAWNYWDFNKQGEYGALNNGKAIGTFANSDGSSPTPDSMMLITPEIDISQLTTPYLSFEWFSNNTNNPGDNVPLIVEIFDGTTWHFIDTLIGDDPEWQFVNYDLSAFSNSIIQVRFMTNQSVAGTAFYNDILLDEVRIDDCVSLGGQDGSLDICRFDNTVDLNNNIIVKPNGGGIWSFPGQPGFLSDSIFTVTYLPTGSYEVYYVERFVCYDTTVATINVFGPSSAGIDGADTVCKNEPIDLFAALGGNLDLGGVWYDFSNTALPNSQPKAQAIPGNYNYIYIVSNGVCPADTAIVTIKVEDDCDFLALGEELFTDISVYPNPATSQLNIVNPSNTASLKVEMLDMNGRIVLIENKALNNASEATLAIDHLEKGVYTLRVYNNEGQKTFKVVKQ